MVARWYFENSPPQDAVQVHLYWGPDGPVADLAPPPALIGLLEDINSVGMDVPNALAAAVLVSARSDTKLRITGDKTAWHGGWGTLEVIN